MPTEEQAAAANEPDWKLAVALVVLLPLYIPFWAAGVICLVLADAVALVLTAGRVRAGFEVSGQTVYRENGQTYLGFWQSLLLGVMLFAVVIAVQRLIIQWLLSP